MLVQNGVLEQDSSTPRAEIPQNPVPGQIAWTNAMLDPSDGILTLDAETLEEIRGLVHELRENPLPIEFLDPAMFELRQCVTLMEHCRTILEDGVGFVIIDRLPMEDYTRDEATKVYWTLMQLLSRPVAQSWDGKLIYDVKDSGVKPGNGVRPDVTSLEQNFHTDNSYNVCPPDYVSLLCLQKAKEGGVSSIISFQAVFNEMLKRHPELVERLFEPYLFNRQMEHSPKAPQVLSHPLLDIVDGKLVCRLSYRHIVNGYSMAGVELDEIGREALDTFEAIMKEPGFFREFYFEPGQIQIVDNKRLGHRRTGFTDYPEAERRRHLVRLWLRSDGRRFYNG
ncbi:TauD/TfdA family dioxygenase [Pollutimonas bauzanensis]|uniref:TauD/TfdA family dioxygenase n=1 Tax=Pollutimonas bauzanensis TaxID=658167 RepID=UPI0033417C10